MNVQEILEEKLGGRLFFDEPLSRHTTFKIGGPARFFYLATSAEELVEAVWLARNLKIKYLVLGGGSNVLFPDEGFYGLVIKNQASSIEIEEVIGKGAHVVAAAGTPSALVLHKAHAEDWTGLELLSGVPGTIGGAVVCNVRAFYLGSFYDKPTSMNERLHSLTVLTPEGEVVERDPDSYEWTATGSNITQTGDIVISAAMNVTKGVPLEAKRYLESYAEFRQDKPYIKHPTCGSIFRNHMLREGETMAGKGASPEELERVQKFLDKGVVPTGWAIDICGLRGEKRGGAQVSATHGNFIVNLGNARAADVLELINLCKDRVYDKLGVRLQEEVRVIS